MWPCLYLKLLRVSFHVLGGVGITLYKVKLESVDVDNLSDSEVTGLEEDSGGTVLQAAALEELTGSETRVANNLLKHSNGIVSEVKGDDEDTVDILDRGVGELGEETHVLSVLLNELLDILLGGLGHKLLERAERILLRSESVVRGNRHSWELLDLIVHLDGLKLLLRGTIVLDAIILGVAVGSTDEESTTVDTDGGSNLEVRGGDELVVGASVHGSTDGGDVGLRLSVVLGELTSLEETREGVATRVGLLDLVHLDGVISKEVVDDVRMLLSIERRIVPGGEEAKNVSVVLEELGGLGDIDGVGGLARAGLVVDLLGGTELVVRSTLLALAVGRVGVNGVRLRVSTDRESILLEEGTSESVSVDDAVDARVDRHISANGKVRRTKVGLSVLGDAVSLDDDSLRKTRVVNLGLNDRHGSILEVVVDDDLADAEVLDVGGVDDLLGEGVEAENLSRDLHPGRSLLTLSNLVVVALELNITLPLLGGGKSEVTLISTRRARGVLQISHHDSVLDSKSLVASIVVLFLFGPQVGIERCEVRDDYCQQRKEKESGECMDREETRYNMRVKRKQVGYHRTLGVSYYFRMPFFTPPKK